MNISFGSNAGFAPLKDSILRLSGTFLLLLIVLSSALGCLSFLFPIQNASATSISATVDPSTNSGTIIYSTERIINLQYDPSTPISRQLNGINQTISFNKSDSDYTMNQFALVLNQYLFEEKHSAAQITNITKVAYLSALNANETIASMILKLEFKVLVNNTFLDMAPNNESSALPNDTLERTNPQKDLAVDARWRDVSIADPIYLETAEYAGININSPIAGIELIEPDLADKLRNASDSNVDFILNQPLLDFSNIGQIPLESWNYSESQGNIIYTAGKDFRTQDTNAIESVSVNRTSTIVTNDETIKVSSEMSKPFAKIVITHTNQKIKVIPEFPLASLVFIAGFSTLVVITIIYQNRAKYLV